MKPLVGCIILFSILATTTALSREIVVDAAGGGNYTTISAALAAVPPGGQTVLVRSGTYAEHLTINTAKTRLVGEGSMQTKIIPPSGANAIAVGAADVEIGDLEISGASVTGGISISATGSRTVIKNIYLHGTKTSGITIGGSDAKIENCTIENVATSPTGTPGGVGPGIFVDGTARPTIRTNRIRGWSQAVGLWYGVADAPVEGNFILDNYGFADSAHAIPRSAVEDYGASVIGHGRNLIVNNVINGSTHNCIEVAQGVVGSQYVGNILRNPGKISNDGSFISVGGQGTQITTDILIAHNYCISDGSRQESGVSIAGQSYRISVFENTLRDFTNSSGTVFIGGSQTSGDIAVEGNQFYNCQYPIRLNNNGDGVLIKNNLMRSVLSTGIYVSSGAKHVIEGNSITVTGDGVTLLGGGGNRLSDNYVNILSGDRAAFIFSSNDNVATNNVALCQNSYNYGVIRFTGWSNLFRQNFINNTGTHDGLTALIAGDYNIFQDNTIAGVVSILVGGSGPHNVYEPNHSGGVTRPSTYKAVYGKVVGAAQVAIAHGLAYVPTQVIVTMTSPGNIYRSAPSDSTYIYLTADAPGRTADIYLR